MASSYKLWIISANLLLELFSIVHGIDVDVKHGMSSPTKCVETDQLLILVHSAPDRVDHRTAIRSTWAQGPVSKLVFLIGNSTEELNLQVQEEASKLGDIFFYDLPDSYYHMTTKHVMGYRWAVENCPSAKYVLKSDDDVFVDTYHLGYFLARHGFNDKPSFLLCNVRANGTAVKRNSEGGFAKWNVRLEDYPEETYPQYCTGAAYVTTVASIRMILGVMAKIESQIHVDDAFVTGLGTRGTGIPFHDWSYYFMNTHADYKKDLLDPEKLFFSPELMVFFNIGPEEIRLLYAKSELCAKYSEKCYDLLWNDGEKEQSLSNVRTEL